MIIPVTTPDKMALDLVRKYHNILHGTETPQKFDPKARSCAKLCIAFLEIITKEHHLKGHFRKVAERIDEVQP